MWVAFAFAKATHIFFQQKYLWIRYCTTVKFWYLSSSLSYRCFEQLSPYILVNRVTIKQVLWGLCLQPCKLLCCSMKNCSKTETPILVLFCVRCFHTFYSWYFLHDYWPQREIILSDMCTPNKDLTLSAHTHRLTRAFVIHLEKRELILVLFVHLFDLRLSGFVCFLFLLVSGKGCGLWLWHSLDLSLTIFCIVVFPNCAQQRFRLDFANA